MTTPQSRVASSSGSTLTGTPYFDDGATDTVANGVEQTLLTRTVSVGLKRQLTRLVLTCRLHGHFKLEVVGMAQPIATGKTGPAEPTVSFDWYPTRDLVAGSQYTLKFKPVAGSPARPISFHLMGADATA